MLLLICFQMLVASFFDYSFPLIYLSACLSVCVSSADININSPSTKPLHAKKNNNQPQKHQVGLCHHAKTTRSFVFLSFYKNWRQRTTAGLDLDGDFFIPVLSAAIAVVLHWADMMPSHSMDLPVPRGTSMLLLDGKGSHHMVQKCADSQTCRVCVTL